MGAGVSGVIVAGGAGRRLGADKARLQFGRRPLLTTLAERLASVCDEVIVACGTSERRALAGQGTLAVPDREPGLGPLAGLQAALAAAASPHVFVTACDMPFLNTELVRHMIELRDGYDAVVPVRQGRPQPLHAVYARDVLGTVEGLLGRGELRLRALIAQLRVREVTDEEICALDPGGLSLFSINTAADLAYARSLWRQRTVDAGTRA